MILHLTNPKGDVLYSTAPSACLECIAARGKRSEVAFCRGTKSRRSRAWETSAQGTVYFCSNQLPGRQNRKITKERLSFYGSLIPQLEAMRTLLKQNISKNMKRLMHNLISQNAHNVQDLYEIVSQDQLATSMADQISTVTQRLKDDPIPAAKMFLKINKNNMVMKAEFVVFNHLHDEKVTPRKRRMHPIHKVVMYSLHLFFQDLRDKNVRVEVEPCDSRVELDYETVQVALYHFFDNTCKYVLPGTAIKIYFPVVDGRLRIVFDMISLRITNTDDGKLFDEGYSGELPKALRLAGEGLGMGIIRDLLKMNDAQILIRRNVDPSRSQVAMLGNYENNQFEIVLGRPI